MRGERGGLSGKAWGAVNYRACAVKHLELTACLCIALIRIEPGLVSSSGRGLSVSSQY